MRLSTSISSHALVSATWILVAACGKNDPSAPAGTATVSGVVRAATGAFIEGASVSIGDATATTGADGRFELENLPRSEERRVGKESRGQESPEGCIA